jgi:hypothetical protein
MSGAAGKGLTVTLQTTKLGWAGDGVKSAIQ